MLTGSEVLPTLKTISFTLKREDGEKESLVERN
jgi:hypothetical protein